MNFQDSLFTGLIAAFIVYVMIYFFGLNYYTWLFQMMAYVVLAAIIHLKTSENGFQDLSNSLSDRFLYVVDEEERRVKKLFTGEEFKIKSTEKVQ